MYCKKCGSEIKEGNTFCTNCGEKINNKEQPIMISFNHSIIVIASICIILVMIFFIIKNNGENKSLLENTSKMQTEEKQETQNNYNNINQISELKINNLDFDIRINSNTNMEVTEIWNISSIENHGFFKTFVLDDKYDGISDVKVCEILSNGKRKELTKTLNGSEYPKEDYYYGLINSKGEFEIAWGVEMKNETKTFQISYTINGALSVNDDFDELYWQFIGKNFSIPISNVEGSINIENLNDIKNVDILDYSKAVNGIKQENNQIVFNGSNLKEGDYLEIRLIFTKDTSTSGNSINSNSPNSGQTENNAKKGYSSIYTGMSYYEVYSILGEPASTTRNTDMFTTYVWTTQEGVIVIQFMNGQVYQKSIH